MFSKLKKKVGVIVRHHKKKLSLFLAVGMMAITQSSAFAGDIVSRGDDGSYSFSIKPLIDDIMNVIMIIINNAVDIFAVGLIAFVVFKLVKKITYKST